MEGRILVAEAVDACGELTEVFRGLWDDVVEELELKTAGVLAVDGNVELHEP